MNVWRKSIQTISRSVRNWDLTKLAKTVFDKSIANGDHVNFIRFSIVVNTEMPFKQILSSFAVNALENELSNRNAVSEKIALSIADFISQLFKVEWVSNNLIHRCMNMIASDQFESFNRVKIMNALIKPIAFKIKKIPYDDSLIFYSKKIQSKVAAGFTVFILNLQLSNFQAFKNIGIKYITTEIYT